MCVLQGHPSGTLCTLGLDLLTRPNPPLNGFFPSVESQEGRGWSRLAYGRAMVRCNASDLPA
jgi:hypothetical protein